MVHNESNPILYILVIHKAFGMNVVKVSIDFCVLACTASIFLSPHPIVITHLIFVKELSLLSPSRWASVSGIVNQHIQVLEPVHWYSVGAMASLDPMRPA